MTRPISGTRLQGSVSGVTPTIASMDIDELYRTASGDPTERPFQYQRRLALEGLPELLDIPTGCGKTKAMLLAWLYRLIFHPDESVRASTPTRLIWCLPLRTLTVQTANSAHEWIQRLGLSDAVDVIVLMGGEPIQDQQWRLNPNRPAIIVSTLDMALSRALNRGYRASRYAWPIDFALFNDDCHWVFDEVQLMGASLATSRQLHGLRTALGVPTRHSSTWMSATIDRDSLITVDASTIDSAAELSEIDRSDERLTQRLEAPKTLLRRPLDDAKKSNADEYAKRLAEVVRSEHAEGTITLAIANSVRIAQTVARLLRKDPTLDNAAVELLHSRFRPPDRAAALARSLAPLEPGAGRIIVATQVVEAGIDLSSTTLITECAPWSSIVQRAGRCNRWGESPAARVVVVESSKFTPYDDPSVESAWANAGKLDDTTVTAALLASETVPEHREASPVLRRKDLLELFDTTPDLSGNDIDVSRFIRADGNLDVSIAWRHLTDLDLSTFKPAMASDEWCSVSVRDARDWFKKVTARAVVFDPLQATWRDARASDIRPGVRVVIDASAGGYSADVGFLASLKPTVEPIEADDSPVGPTAESDEAVGDDRLTTDVASPVSLTEHLADADAAAIELCAQLGVADPRWSASMSEAARLHDVGKAHPVFQSALLSAVSVELPESLRTVPLAKSGGGGRLRYSPDRRGFRHELVSALVLMNQRELIRNSDADADLVTYLVGAHHGRVRLGVRPLPGELEGAVLGVHEGDDMPAVNLGNGTASTGFTLSLKALRFGAEYSWSERAGDLLEQYGPFTLAWLEAMVRIADWRASSKGANQ